VKNNWEKPPEIKDFEKWAKKILKKISKLRKGE